MENVQHIPLEGRQIDPVRNIERMVLEVVAAVGSGCTIEGHRVRGWDRDQTEADAQPSRIEIYADRLDAVLARVRTPKHLEIHRQAVEACKNGTAEWIERHQAEYDGKRTQQDRDRFVHMNCNLRPEHFYRMLGQMKTGLPPLASCKVVHPESETTITVAEFQKLSADKRKEWLIGAPTTAQNAVARANTHLAEAIERALGNRDEKKR